MHQRASTVHALCNPPAYDEYHSPASHHPTPPAMAYLPPYSNAWDIHVPSTANQYFSAMMPEQNRSTHLRGPWHFGEEGARPSSPPSKRTLCISNLVENHGMAAIKAPEKRKADDISTVNPEEERWAAGTKEDRTVVAPPTPAPSSPLCPDEIKNTDSQNAESKDALSKDALSKDIPSKDSENMDATTTLSSGCGTEREVVESKFAPVQPHVLPKENSYTSPVEAAETASQRPAKRQRIRDIAERVGYAALGGVTAGAMIVGTLIYTAPTFA